MRLCGLELAHPIVNGSGTFDAIAARRAFGDTLLERFPFHAFVSKTITLAPREGNPPPRLWETPAGKKVQIRQTRLVSFTDRHLVAMRYEVTVLDDLSTGHADAVPSGARFVEASLHDSGPVLADARPEAVLHFAAKSLVGVSQQQPEDYWHTNVGGSLALLEAMRAADCRRIVFSSTAATYGEPESVPIREDAPPEPDLEPRRRQAGRR